MFFLAPCMNPTIFPILLVVFYAIWQSGDRMDGCCPSWNWERRHALLNADSTVRPASLTNITECVQFASAHNKRITVLGSGHSWADITVPADKKNGRGSTDGSSTGTSNSAVSNGSIVLCMRCYSGLVGVDRDKKQVTVLGGTTLAQLITILDEYDLALDIFPSVNEQTIAGAISSGTHGTGVTHGNMATLVQSIELVTADGTVLTASRSSNADVLYGATIGMGLFGIITKVTLQATEKFNVYEKKILISSDELYANLEGIVGSAEYVKLWHNEGTGQVCVFTSSRTTEPVRDNRNRVVQDIGLRIFEGLIYLVSFYPRSAKPVMYFLIHYLDALKVGERVSTWHDVFNIPHHIPVHPETEYAVPLANATAALRYVAQLVEEKEIGTNYISETRFVGADEFWLSNDYGTPTCHITLLLYNQEDVFQSYMQAVSDGLVTMGARPHWGKMSKMTEATLKHLYPKWDDFVALKRRLDPSGRFCNSQAQQAFDESNIC